MTANAKRMNSGPAVEEVANVFARIAEKPETGNVSAWLLLVSVVVVFMMLFFMFDYCDVLNSPLS